MAADTGRDSRPIESFPAGVLDVLARANWGSGLDGVQVLGTASNRELSVSASDVDAFITVTAPFGDKAKAAAWAAKRFQRAVRRLLQVPLLKVGDIKAGVLTSARVMPWLGYWSEREHRVVGYEMAESIAAAGDAATLGLATDEEAAEAKAMLRKAGPTPSRTAWWELQDTLRWDVVRWTVQEVLAGRKRTRAGMLTLQTALLQPAIAKIDLVVYLPSAAKYTDVSCIYALKTSDGAAVNDFSTLSLPLLTSIRGDVVRYGLGKGKIVKAAKRMYSLARLQGKKAAMKKLASLLTGDAASLYAVAADAGTAAWLAENAAVFSAKRLKIELDAMKARVSQARDVLAASGGLEEAADAAIAKAVAAKSHAAMAIALEELDDALAPRYNEFAKAALSRMRLWPPPKWSLP